MNSEFDIFYEVIKILNACLCADYLIHKETRQKKNARGIAPYAIRKKLN
jgi:hypothetical protein